MSALITVTLVAQDTPPAYYDDYCYVIGTLPEGATYTEVTEGAFPPNVERTAYTPLTVLGPLRITSSHSDLRYVANRVCSGARYGAVALLPMDLLNTLYEQHEAQS